MHTRRWWALGGLLGAIALVAGLTSSAQSQKPPAEETFSQRLAKAAQTPEENANRVYQALGPVIREELSRGKQVNLPGLGTFRVVRVEEHKDLRDGRPVVVPAVNTVEFVSNGELLDVANSAGAKPAETVPAFHYTPLPSQTPGQKVGPTRAPSSRIR